MVTLTHRAFAFQATDFRAMTYRNARRETLPYRLFIPKAYDKRDSYPLVLWLHGGAGRGADNLKQISGGNTIGSHVWTTTEQQAKHPCFVVAPQCPEDNPWSTLNDVQPTRPLELVVELLDDLSHTFKVDAQRLYVSGQSMGGFGTWALVAQNPRKFAAAIPVCGGGNEASAAQLTKMPIWAFHGEKDQSVNVTRSRSMITAIKQAGGAPRYTEYQGAGHTIWERVFAEPELLPWVFAQRA